MFGCAKDELIGRSPHFFSPTIQPDGSYSNECIDERISHVYSGKPQVFEWTHQTLDQRPFPTLISLNRVALDDDVFIQAIVSDLTALKQAEHETKLMEKKLQQAEKMEAIGTLAGGIAHDFNNILSAIVGYTELAMMVDVIDQERSKYLEQVLKASRRAKDLVSQILTFSRRNEVKQTPIRVDLIVKEALKFIRASIPSTIDIRDEIQETRRVMADPIQIYQIVINLCSNAGFAMKESGGVLTVTLREEIIEEKNGIDARLALSPGHYIGLKVEDTGEGISPELMDSIFDPFFTTKASGEGTGMGLAVVHGIVQSLKGAIDVKSEPGKGASFHVLIPSIHQQIDASSVSSFQANHGVEKGNERILYIDDEPQLAQSNQLLLERLGYQVTAMTDSSEALLLFKSNPDHFDLVITDLLMPDMTGDLLAREVMEIRPEIPVIICSGFTGDIKEDELKAIGIRAFLMKPFSLSELAQTIRTVLDPP